MPRVTFGSTTIHDGDVVQLMGTLTIDTLGQQVTLFVDNSPWTPVDSEDGILTYTVAQGGFFDVRVNGRGVLRFTNTFDPAAFRVDSVEPAYHPSSSTAEPVDFVLLGDNLNMYEDNLEFRFSPDNLNPFFPGSGWAWHALSEATDVSVNKEDLKFTYSTRSKCYLSAIRRADTQEVVWTNNSKPIPLDA